MTMFRRSPKLASPLRNRQEELNRREAELRARVEQLERMIADTSRLTHFGSQEVGQERPKMEPVDKRLQVLIGLDEANESKKNQQPGSLRRQRREGRWIFLLLLAAFAAAVAWLMTHLPF
jgi:hypothetical protein